MGMSEGRGLWRRGKAGLGYGARAGDEWQAFDAKARVRRTEKVLLVAILRTQRKVDNV